MEDYDGTTNAFILASIVACKFLCLLQRLVLATPYASGSGHLPSNAKQPTLTTVVVFASLFEVVVLQGSHPQALATSLERN